MSMKAQEAADIFLQDGNNSACYRLPHTRIADKRMSDSSFRKISATSCICGQNFGQATPATYGTMEALAKTKKIS
ncbi:MAG: hypothetical protein ACYC21_08215 [Eubacteriales bacterium]